jgi:hypothetical protein
MRDRFFCRCHGLARIAALIASSVFFAGCFQLPDRNDDAAPVPSRNVSQAVRTALAGRPDDALTYAGLYEVLADRLEANVYPTTTEAAQVAGRAADILRVPGSLKQVVNDELIPLIGKPQPLTPELCAKAAAKLRALSAACREAAQ